MTYFLNFRMRDVGGPVVGPHLLAGDGTAVPPALSVIPPAQIPSLVAGKALLFAAHGFNVSYHDGAYALGMLDRYLDLTASNLFIGVLWPGDAWLPIVDYPFEGGVARECGGRALPQLRFKIITRPPASRGARVFTPESKVTSTPSR